MRMFATHRSNKISKHVPGIAVLLVLLMIFIHQLRHPQYDWDMLPYMAIALMDAGDTIDAAHHKVYDAIQVDTPAATYDELTTGKVKTTEYAPRYRRDATFNFNKFAASLPFYAVKPVYPALISLLYLRGVDLVVAAGIIAGIGYLASCLVVYVWLKRWLSARIAAPLTIMLALVPQLTAVAKLPTPDSLSLFVLLLGLYLAIEHDRVILGLATLVVAIAVRPENILYFITFASYFSIMRKFDIRIMLLAVGAIAVFIIIRDYSHSYAWSTLFYFTFIDPTIDLSRFISPLRIIDYITIYMHQLKQEILNPEDGIPIFMLIGFGAAAMKIRAGDFRDPYLHLIFLVCILAIGRMLLLPLEAFRALLPCYILVTLALIQACVNIGRQGADAQPGSGPEAGAGSAGATWS